MVIEKKKTEGRVASLRFLSTVLLTLIFLIHYDIQNKTYDHKTHSCYLYPVVVIPSAEIATNQNDGSNDNDNCSKIFFEIVHNYMM